MPDVNPIANSAKTISGGINSARDAGKELTKTIQSVQKDVTDVAIEQDKQRRKAQRNIEDKESLLVFKAIEEYERLNNILKKEEKAKADFINKHGLKEWNKVVQLKIVVVRSIGSISFDLSCSIAKSSGLISLDFSIGGTFVLIALAI